MQQNIFNKGLTGPRINCINNQKIIHTGDFDAWYDVTIEKKLKIDGRLFYAADASHVYKHPMIYEKSAQIDGDTTVTEEGALSCNLTIFNATVSFSSLEVDINGYVSGNCSGSGSVVTEPTQSLIKNLDLSNLSVATEIDGTIGYANSTDLATLTSTVDLKEQTGVLEQLHLVIVDSTNLDATGTGTTTVRTSPVPYFLGTDNSFHVGEVAVTSFTLPSLTNGVWSNLTFQNAGVFNISLPDNKPSYGGSTDFSFYKGGGIVTFGFEQFSFTSLSTQTQIRFNIPVYPINYRDRVAPFETQFFPFLFSEDGVMKTGYMWISATGSNKFHFINPGGYILGKVYTIFSTCVTYNWKDNS